MILTYTLSLVRLLISIPNKFAFINIVFNFGINLKVIKKAITDIKAFTIIGKYIFHIGFDISVFFAPLHTAIFRKLTAYTTFTVT